MIQAQLQLLFMPEKAWQQLSEKPSRQTFLLPLLVYPLLILAALSVFIPYNYGYTTLPEAVKESVITFIKYLACIITAWSCISALSRHYYLSPCDNKKIHNFVGYCYTIQLLTIIVLNLLPSSFSFVEFAPLYTIWIIYKGKDYLEIPDESKFNFVLSASALMLGLPFVWTFILNIILH